MGAVTLCTGDSSFKSTDVKATFRKGMIYEALIGSGMFKKGKITIDIPGERFIVHH